MEGSEREKKLAAVLSDREEFLPWVNGSGCHRGVEQWTPAVRPPVETLASPTLPHVH
jgi:hypothetical protein